MVPLSDTVARAGLKKKRKEENQAPCLRALWTRNVVVTILPEILPDTKGIHNYSTFRTVNSSE